MAEKRAIKALYSLYRIVEAGEKGYAVCAVNVRSPGLKILFKSYAQQRAKFKSEILDEICRFDEEAMPRSSLRSIVHRGRIDIFSALIIENETRENMVLKEIRIGEKAALSAYERTLQQDLSPEFRVILAHQFEDVRGVNEQIRLMLGKNGKRMLVQLFDTEKDVEAALLEMKKSGFSPDEIQRIPFESVSEIYVNRGTTIFETIISGAVGGALWGSVVGALAGIGAGGTTIWIPSILASPSGLWAFIALCGILGGALVGSILGFVLGLGIAEDDKFSTAQNMGFGHIILLTVVDILKASEANRILAKVNREARFQAQNLPA